MKASELKPGDRFTVPSRKDDIIFEVLDLNKIFGDKLPKVVLKPVTLVIKMVLPEGFNSPLFTIDLTEEVKLAN